MLSFSSRNEEPYHLIGIRQEILNESNNLCDQVLNLLVSADLIVKGRLFGAPG